jgi:hypothetical protein
LTSPGNWSIQYFSNRSRSTGAIGRFGYGLPSSSMSQGKRFEVYSKIEGGQWYKAYLDLEEIEEGLHTDDHGMVVVPEAVPTELPKWVKSYIAKNLGGLKSGTVVLIDKLDNNTWKRANDLQDNLLRHFGVTYHKLRAEVDIFVNSTRCDPIDPLFLTPGYRWYDLDSQRAQAMEPMVIEVRPSASTAAFGSSIYGAISGTRGRWGTGRSLADSFPF